jgi:hypothetical protein
VHEDSEVVVYGRMVHGVMHDDASPIARVGYL